MGDTSIKVVIKTENGDENIYLKHFIGSNTYFEDFKVKILQRFPSLREKQFKLYWIDSDKDQITIFNEEDFRMFYEQTKDYKYIVYLEEKAKSVKFIPTTETTKTEKEPSKEIHPKHLNVECDVCGIDIVGIRYKCLECPNFDLCMKCEQNLAHREHPMLRFYAPAEYINWSKCNFDRIVRTYRRRSTRCEASPKIEISLENLEKPSKCRRGGHHKSHSRSNATQCEEQQNNIWTTIMKYMQDLANAESEVSKTEGKESASSAKANEKKPECLNFIDLINMATKPHLGYELIKTATDENSGNASTNTNTVNSTVQECVIPIQVENQKPVNESSQSNANNITEKPRQQERIIPIEIEDQQPAIKPTAAIASVQKTQSPPENDEDKTNKLNDDATKMMENLLTVLAHPHHFDNSKNNGNSCPFQKELQQEVSPDSDKEWDVIDEESVLENLEKRRGSPPSTGAIAKAKENIITKSTSSNTSLENIPKQLINFNEEVTSSGTNLFENGKPNPQTESLKDSRKSSSSESLGSRRSPTNSNSPLPDFAKLGRDLQKHIQEQLAASKDHEKEIFHRKPHVNSALITMMAMGFSNEGGWLGQLLDSVDGNISKALDLLQPVQR